MDKMPQQQQIQVELDEKAAEGIYSKFVLTAHNAAELVLDLARLVPGVPKAKVHARIIMTPQSAKSLNLALADAIGKFENNFGKINIAPRNNPLGSIGFQSGTGEDLEKKKN
jgi:hypothetical protein